MDFAFLQASNTDYTLPNLKTNQIVELFDEYSLHLLIIDETSRKSLTFTTKMKEPPIELVSIFLTTYGLESGGFIRCDQGGELARLADFVDMMLRKFNYKVEPTGADSPSQNSGAERWNLTFAVMVRSLLYSAGSGPEYWSAALRHVSYLHDRRVHSVTGITPYEGWWGTKPNLRHLKVFGYRVCVKKTGD